MRHMVYRCGAIEHQYAIIAIDGIAGDNGMTTSLDKYSMRKQLVLTSSPRNTSFPK